MRFNIKALDPLIDLSLSAAEIADQLTALGLEVESVKPVAPFFSGVLVGKIITCVPHPKADRLQVCEVSIGQADVLSIVCGAKNARAGLMVAVAQVGAVLPNDCHITRAKLRGVDSCGMLCSANELQLAEDASEGILELLPEAPLGENLRTYLALDDVMIDFSVTPNRGDCLSVLGVARELAAKNHLTLTSPERLLCAADDAVTLTVPIVSAPAACPRYLVAALDAVDNQCQTPVWMTRFLTEAGMRPVSLIVDVLNVVMLMTGQPLHAFDADKVSGALQVRFAKSGEKITLLNQVEHVLDDTVLVIADETQLLAIAGITGASAAEVSPQTQRVLIESAFFTPAYIVGRARRFSVHSEAAQRFERGVDFLLPKKALELALSWIQAFTSAKRSDIKEVSSEKDYPLRQSISFSPDQIEKRLGVSICTSEAQNSLVRLGCEVKVLDALWRVTPPSWRFDLSLAEDLIEEVARLYGYDNIAATLPQSILKIPSSQNGVLPIHDIAQALQAQGFCEVMTYSFIDPKWQSDFEATHVTLSNPLSHELSLMRSSLIPGLLEVLMYNERRQQQDLKCFETGRVFRWDNTAVLEEDRLGLLMTGQALTLNWRNHTAVDFYLIKGVIENLGALTQKADFSFVKDQTPSWLHPLRSAQIFRQEKAVGVIGELHPKLVNALHLNSIPYLAEISLSALSCRMVPKAIVPGKFPSVRRDLSFLVASEVRAGDMVATVREVAGDLLMTVSIFDVYEGERLAVNQKSIAFAMILQHAKGTLQDETVEALTQRVIQALGTRFNATLRA